jgi:hypothetical protein
MCAASATATTARPQARSNWPIWATKPASMRCSTCWSVSIMRSRALTELKEKGEYSGLTPGRLRHRPTRYRDPGRPRPVLRSGRRDRRRKEMGQTLAPPSFAIPAKAGIHGKPGSRPAPGRPLQQLGLQIRVQIDPTRVVTLDQVELPLAFPFFDLLFPADRRFDRIVRFEPDQSVDAIARGEAGTVLFLCSYTRFARSKVTPTYSVP